jgi:hypothetical protein
MLTSFSLSIAPADLDWLQAREKDRNAPQKHLWRARIVLITAEDLGTNSIMRERRRHFLARNPGLIVSDHWTELASNAMLAWAQSSRTASHLIAAGRPMQKVTCETFNASSPQPTKHCGAHIPLPLKQT